MKKRTNTTNGDSKLRLNVLVNLFGLVLVIAIGTAMFRCFGDEQTEKPIAAPEFERDESGGLERLDLPFIPSPGPSPREHFEYREGSYSFAASPNFSERNHGVEGIVVHVTGGGTCAGIASWFANKDSKVSSHFTVCKDGTVLQHVDTAFAAWHVGIVNKPNRDNPLIANWLNRGVNPNRPTLGIEVQLAVGEVLGDYPHMLWSFDELLLWAVYTFNLPADRVHVIGHFEIDSVNRAVDPICCIDIDASAAYAAYRLNALPVELTLEQRVRRIEELLGITD